MPTIPTVKITVNGKSKIVNADDPRAAQSNKPATKPRGKPRKPKADVDGS